MPLEQSEPVGPDWIVMRLRPTDPQAVLNKALQEPRAFGTDHVGVSVWASAPMVDEATTLKHLLAVADMKSDNKNLFVCSAAEKVLARGFSFVKDRFPGEPPEHYCVKLEPADLATTQRLLSVFEARPVRDLESE